jgi:hypothetical protein
MPWLIRHLPNTVARGLLISSLFVVERNAENAKSIIEMAEPEIVIHTRLEWQSTDADGQSCEVCGDAIYFPRAWQLIIYCGRRGILSTDIFICDSCHEMATTL